MIRVLVVDDSATARRLLVSIVGADEDMEVVAEAANGAEAVRLAARLRPDVITMDINMPEMDGFEATSRIMERTPTPIVVVTTRSPSDAVATFKALGAGALVVLERPGGPGTPGHQVQADALRSTIRRFASIKVRTRPLQPDGTPRAVAGRPRRAPVDVVAIAASTGGPAALAQILGTLPGDLPVPALVVQHMTPGFERGFVDWLGTLSKMGVVVAADGLRMRPGEVYVSPGGVHIGVSRARTIVHDDGEPIGGFKPSATHLFRSVASVYGPSALAVILTGMGKDGVAGLVDIHKAGGWVLGQDEASSVVHGMPGQAFAEGLVDSVLALGEFAAAITDLCRR